MRWVAFFAFVISSHASNGGACRVAVSALVLEHSKGELAATMSKSPAEAETFFRTLIQSSENIHGAIERGDFLAATQSLMRITRNTGMPPSKINGMIEAMTPTTVRGPTAVTTPYGNMMSQNNEAFMIALLNGKAETFKMEIETLDERAMRAVDAETAARWKDPKLFYSDMAAAHKVAPEFNRVYTQTEGELSPGDLLKKRFSPSSAELFNFVYENQKSNNFGDAFQLTLVLMHACAVGDRNLSIELLSKQDQLRNKDALVIEELWRKTQTAVADSKLRESLTALRAQ